MHTTTFFSGFYIFMSTASRGLALQCSSFVLFFKIALMVLLRIVAIAECMLLRLKHSVVPIIICNGTYLTHTPVTHAFNRAP